MNGTALLAVFRRNRNEEAFGELVRRYTNLVYSVVKRRVANLALAQDVTQLVFIRLAKSAPKLHNDGQLVAWLHRTAIHASIDLWRSETRRRLREEQAVAMQLQPQSQSPDPGHPSWDNLSTVLDEALNELNEAERQTILLRFFEGRTMRELGALFGVSEDAAKMRVSRALERLRGRLGGRGFACSATALGAILTERTVEAAPSQVAATLAALVASLPATLGVGTSTFAALTQVTRQKLAAGLACAVLVGVGLLVYLRSSSTTDQRASNAGSPKPAATLGAPGADSTNSGTTGAVEENDPDPRQLLRGIAQAREQITSGSIEFRLTAEEDYSWQTTTNHQEVSILFDGNKLRWESSGDEYGYDSAEDAAQVEQQGITRAAAIRAGLLRRVEAHEVNAYDGAVWLAFRESNQKPEGTRVYAPEEAGPHRIFNPRCLGLRPQVRLNETPESCLGLDEAKSIRLVGRESLHGLPTWRVHVQSKHNESLDFWIDAQERSRLRQVTQGDRTAVSSYDVLRTRDPIPTETIVTMKFNSLSKVAGMRWRYVRTSAQFKHPIDPVSFTLNGLGMPVGTSVSDDRVRRHIGYWNGSGLSESPVDVRVGVAAPMARDMAELLATLQAEPRSESALEAATWILLNTPDGPEVEQAASVITNQHLMNTNLLVLCDGLERMRPRCATNLLSALMSGNPETEIRGRACWTLAGLWKDAADYGRNQAAAVMAEKLYERVLREFGQLKCPKNAKPGARTLAELAEPELSELRRLGIGKTAPNIEGFDLEGQPMSLADYRGRVVLLVFWISGCSEAPHLRKLLEELEGKPFVVLGVNCDNKREKAQADIDKYGITWRSFWDKRNGPIAQQWNVTSWADFWVIDADGVIRVRGWNEHYFGLKKLLGLE